MNQYIIFDNIIYTYMAQVRVDVAGDNITINDRDVNPNIATLFDTFKRLCDTAKVPIDGMGSFDQLNQNINRADSIKDGTSSGNDLLYELFPQESNWSLADLKNIIGGVKTYCIENNLIQRFTFTRTKADGSDNSRNWGLDTRKFRIGYDAGLGLDTLFPNDYTKILIETFGKYIDPSTGGRDAKDSFPTRGITLDLTANLFAKFGYLGAAMCRLQATNAGQDQYDYEMLLANKQISANTGTDRAKDRNITTYFGGNAEKSKLLKQSSTDAVLKKQVIVGKGLGDKLQVIILWIRSKITEGGNTGIATCDEVVALLCLILQLTFFLTSTSRDGDNVKIDEVLFYNPGGQNVDVALERYNQEYAIVLDSYRDNTSLIERLRTNPIPVIASGGGVDVLQIPDYFYNAMIEDLATIHGWIEGTYHPGFFMTDATASTIYGEMSHLKKLTARQIFKLNKTGNICQFVRTAKTYTCDDRILHYPFDKPKLQMYLQNGDISRSTFYDLFKNIPKKGGGNGQSTGMTTGATGESAGSGKASGGTPRPFFPEAPPVPDMRRGDPFHNAGVNQDTKIVETDIQYKQSDFFYIDPILAAIKSGDLITDKTGTGTDVGAMRTRDIAAAEEKPAKAARADSGAKAVTETESGDGDNSIPDNCSPIGVFDANAALRIELYELYNNFDSWIKNDMITITFWEVLNESMEVFVYDPRYNTKRLNELISNFSAGSLYVDVPGPGGPAGSGPTGPGGPAGTGPLEQADTSQFTMSNSPWRLGEMKEPFYVAWILNEWNKWKIRMETAAAEVTMNVAAEDAAARLKTAEAAGRGSGSPPPGSAKIVGAVDTPMGANEGSSSAPKVTPAARQGSPAAGQGSPAGLRDTAYANLELTNESDSESREMQGEGGSRRSTRRRKYRNTKRPKKHTTRRKKTGKQSSKTRRSTKRRRNKKRRNITRKTKI